jgi:hypothetical protein
VAAENAGRGGEGLVNVVLAVGGNDGAELFAFALL